MQARPPRSTFFVFIAALSLLLNVIIVMTVVFGGISGKKPDQPLGFTSSKYTVVGAGGRRVAEIGATPSGFPYLSMADGKGVVRMYASVSAAGCPSVELCDGEGKTRAEVSVNESGSPRVYLKGQGREILAVMGVDNTGVPFLTFLDGSGLPRLSAGSSSLIDTDGGVARRRPASSLVLSNEKGEVIWSMPR